MFELAGNDEIIVTAQFGEAISRPLLGRTLLTYSQYYRIIALLDGSELYVFTLLGLQVL